MDAIWLLKGPYEAPGWKPLEAEARADKIDVLLFDRAAWALMRAPEAPTKYEGLVASVPSDGLYLDDQGRGPRSCSRSTATRTSCWSGWGGCTRGARGSPVPARADAIRLVVRLRVLQPSRSPLRLPLVDRARPGQPT